MVDAAPSRALEREDFEWFRTLIASETGIALKTTKKSLLEARLMRRLRALGLGSFSAYRERLVADDADGVELRNFINAITTNKTSFFREPHHFDLLRREAQTWPGEIRIWSAASSTGEEPYSIAFTLLEAGKAAPDVSILATDIDTDVLERAERGVYPMEALPDWDERRLKRFALRGFGANDGYFQVRPEIRERIRFGRLNLVHSEWAVDGVFDAIFCRNVMIYFDLPLQQKIVRRLVRHLRPGGLLFVGNAETLFWMRDSLTPAAHSAYRLTRQP